MSGSIATPGKDFDSMKNPPALIQPRSNKARMSKSARPPSSNRHKVLHDYHDHAQATAPPGGVKDIRVGGEGDKRKGPRGGVMIPFPTKLHIMLSKVENSGLSHVVSWQPHGRCFVVHKPKEFVTEVMPIYFRQSKLTSFQRQLNLYGFARITTGRDRGGYYHELFLKHKLFLCQNMSRIRIKGTGIKGKASPETEPDFYSMPWVQPDDTSIALNCKLEDEITVAMREENQRYDPTKRQNEGEENKGASRKNRKKKNSETGGVTTPRSGPVPPPFEPSALVTPDNRNTKKTLPVSVSSSLDTPLHRILSEGSTGMVEKQDLADLCPPLMPSDSDDTNDTQNGNLHSGDEITFEGKHFHYLDSFAVQSPPRPFLEPRKTALAKCRGVAALSFPRLESRLSEPHEQSLSIAQSLREPILTPSSSSSSLSEMFQQDPTMEMNPDAIFSDCGFNEDWEMGAENVDIDAEFKMLGA